MAQVPSLAQEPLHAVAKKKKVGAEIEQNQIGGREKPRSQSDFLFSFQLFPFSPSFLLFSLSLSLFLFFLSFFLFLSSLFLLSFPISLFHPPKKGRSERSRERTRELGREEEKEQGRKKNDGGMQKTGETQDSG